MALQASLAGDVGFLSDGLSNFSDITVTTFWTLSHHYSLSVTVNMSL
jgi:hypothetical protein